MKIGRKSPIEFLFFIFCSDGITQIQNLLEYRTDQPEAFAEKKDAVLEDDDYALNLEQLSRHPLNLNAAVEQDLIQLPILQALQISNFIMYRKLLGPLLTVHELQAITGWDIKTIRELLSYIIVGRDESVYTALRERWQGGDAAFLIRCGQVLEKIKGFE